MSSILTPARMTLRLPPRETDLEFWARDEIEKAGGWMVKWTAPGRKGPPDDLCFWHYPSARRGFRKVVDFLEFKLPDTGPEQPQIDFHAKLRAMGWDILLPRTREDIVQYIERRRPRDPV